MDPIRISTHVGLSSELTCLASLAEMKPHQAGRHIAILRECLQKQY